MLEKVDDNLLTRGVLEGLEQGDAVIEDGDAAPVGRMLGPAVLLFMSSVTSHGSCALLVPAITVSGAVPYHRQPRRRALRGISAPSPCLRTVKARAASPLPWAEA